MDFIHSAPDLSQTAKTAKSSNLAVGSASFDRNIDQLFSNVLSLTQQNLRTVADDKKQQSDDKKSSGVLQRDDLSEPSANTTRTNNFKRLVKAWRKLIHALSEKSGSQPARLAKSNKLLEASKLSQQSRSVQTEAMAVVGMTFTKSQVPLAVGDGPLSIPFGQTLPPQNEAADSVATFDDVGAMDGIRDILSLDGSIEAVASGDVGIDPSTQETKTIADILAGLQALAQLISKHLSQDAVPNAAGTSNVSLQMLKTDATDGELLKALNLFSADSPQGIISVNEATYADAVTQTKSDTQNNATETDLAPGLSELLAIAVKITKQLDAVAGQASAKTAQPPMNASAQAADINSNAALTSNIQGLLDSLKSITALTAQQSQGSSVETADTDSTLVKNEERRAQVVQNAPANLPLLGASSANLQPQGNLRNAIAENRPRSLEAAANAHPPAIVVPQESFGDNGSFNTDKNPQSAASALLPSATTENPNLATSLGAATSSSPYNFASQLSFTKATTLGTTGLPPAVEQVIFQLNRNVKSGNDQLSLQLNPAELGRVTIKLNINADGKVNGTVVASNPGTLDLLLKDVRSLERALQDAGLRADSGSLQFSLGGQPGQSDHSSSNKNTRAAETAVDADLATLETAETYYLTPGRVNLRV